MDDSKSNVEPEYLVGASNSNGWIEMAMGMARQSDLMALRLSSKPAANAKHVPCLKYNSYQTSSCNLIEVVDVLTCW